MKRFKNILCVVEPASAFTPTLERAIALAESNQAHLTAVALAPDFREIRLPDENLTPAGMLEELNQQLNDFVGPYLQRLAIKTKVLTGKPFLEITREVLRERHDLVIKVAEHQDWLDRLLGSDDMYLLRKCPCPVLVFKAQGPKSFRRILAAVDADNAYPQNELETRNHLNREILELASSVAIAEAAELHIVHAWHAIGESALRHGAFAKRPEKEVNAYVNEVRDQHAANLSKLLGQARAYTGQEAFDYLNPVTHLVKGAARKEIPDLAKRLNVDLVVMGTVARTGIAGFVMGNTAEDILNRIQCSVLAIKPPGFQTPVTGDATS